MKRALSALSWSRQVKHTLHGRLAGILLVVLLASCSNSGNNIPTPLPEEYLPTAIALTLEASGVLTAPQAASPTAVNTLAATAAPSATATQPALPSDTPTPLPPSATPTAIVLLPAQPTPTFPAFIPEARIAIFRLGELSKVRSPLQVTIQISRGAVGPLRVELLGENGRLLARQVKTLPANFSGQSTEIAFKIDFEIPATAEVGRLVVTTQDAKQRLLAVNSVNLILMSIGEPELNPASALFEPLVIQQPAPKTLIQGGVLMLTGVARPDSDKPLRVQLVAEDGRVVGQRLAAVVRDPSGGYGPFAVDVPYSVSSLTPVRLIVYEDGEGISPIAHLTSMEVVLSP